MQALVILVAGFSILWVDRGGVTQGKRDIIGSIAQFQYPLGGSWGCNLARQFDNVVTHAVSVSSGWIVGV